MGQMWVNVYSNTTPVITTPGAQLIQAGTTLTLSTGNTNLISIADSDGGSQTVDLTASNSGLLTLASTTGITINTGSDGSSAMNISGTLADINAALDGLQYDPNGDVGAQTITISTDDGNGGTDGPDVVNVNVAPYVVAAHFFDVNLDGDIDEMVIELNEEVDETSAEAADFSGSSGLTIGAVSTVASTNVGNTLDANDNDQYVTFEVSGVTGTDISGISIVFANDNANLELSAQASGLEAFDNGDVTEVDAAPPVILAASNVLQANNAYLQVTFSEGIYNNAAGAVSALGGEFTLDFQQETGTATAGSIDDLTTS